VGGLFLKPLPLQLVPMACGDSRDRHLIGEHGVGPGELERVRCSFLRYLAGTTAGLIPYEAASIHRAASPLLLDSLGPHDQLRSIPANAQRLFFKVAVAVVFHGGRRIRTPPILFLQRVLLLQLF